MIVKRFLIEAREVGWCYALTTQKVETREILIPPIVRKLLKEYVDVLPEELPNGLPPKRDI